MPRDYKDINKQAKKANRRFGPFLGNLLSLVTGLSLGILLAVYLFTQPDWLQKYSFTAYFSNNRAQAAAATRSPAPAIKGPDKVDAPIPKFEFYDILRKRKLNISETVASEQESRSSATDTASVYVLQLGSFNDYQAADKLKAQLALIGVTSYITKVVLNGHDIIHRVRAGPFENPAKLRETRQRLDDNRLDYTLLKLELDDAGN